MAIKNYVEVRRLDALSLSSLCVQKKWYNCGDSKEYMNLFARLSDENGSPAEMTTEKLAEIAEDILAHTDWTALRVEDVMYLLNKKCVTCFVQV